MEQAKKEAKQKKEREKRQRKRIAKKGVNNNGRNNEEKSKEKENRNGIMKGNPKNESVQSNGKRLELIEPIQSNTRTLELSYNGPNNGDDIEKRILHIQLDAAQQAILVMEQQLSKAQKVHEQRINGYTGKLQTLEHSLDQLENRVMKLEQSVSQQSKQNYCTVCDERLRDILLLPCSHVILCKNCYDNGKYQQCPSCSSQLSGIIHCKFF